MNFDEFVKKYCLLQDEEGRYYRINENGKKEEPYATVPILSKIFNIGPRAIRKRIKQTPSINIKNKKMRIVRTYNINEVIQACSELITTPQIMSKNGIAIINGEQYATISQLVKILNLGYDSIDVRVKKLQSISMKDKGGRIVKYYDIKKVKIACADLLQNIPVANEDGIAVFQGKKIATIHRLSDLLGISDPSINVRIKNLQSISMKNKMGRIVNGYDIEEVKIACADLLQDIPVANENGIAVFQGEKFAPVQTICDLLKLSYEATQKKAKNLQSISMKVKVGHITKGYNIEETKRACADLLQDVPVAGDDNIAVFQGKNFATIKTISALLGISNKNIKNAVINLQPITIKTKMGQIVTGYDIEKVKIACAYFLQDIPVANEDGIAVFKGKKFAPINTIGHLLNTSNHAIKRRVKDLQPISMKIKCGRIVKGYEIKEAKTACADLLEEKKKK
jgi:hypothetical protein